MTDCLDVSASAPTASPDSLSPTHPGRAPSRAARAERLLTPAAFITALGNNVQVIAGAVIMIRAAGSMMAVGWLFIAVAAPQAVLSPLFGWLADRRDRRRLWIGCDSASALLALVLPVWLAAGGNRSAGIYGANFALAVAAAREPFVLLAAMSTAAVALASVLLRPSARVAAATATNAGQLLDADPVS